MRSVSDRNILDKFCIDFCRVLEKHCRYIIVSGFVAISSGRARGTEDIDVIIEKLDKERFKKLHDALLKKGFECMQSKSFDIIFDDYLVRKDSVRYIWKGEFLPEMELKFSKDRLDEYQLKTRVKLKLTGLDVWFSSININIAFKEEYLKSDKDLEDSGHLRIVYSDIINEKEIRKVKDMIKKYRLK